MRMRAPDGDRHMINLETGVFEGMTKVKATCICGKMKTPPRFGREKAEEDGHDHMARFGVKGKVKR
jgi:hypothetical protein